MGFEEDTYSSIFLALKHPIRRRILRMLSEKPASYTKILETLGVETGFLNYHLDSLSGLIAKDKDGRYLLSEFGEAAISLIRGVEEPVRRRTTGWDIHGFKIPSNVIYFAIIIMIASNVYWVYAHQEVVKDKTNAVGGALIQIKGLLNESIDVLNTTMNERILDFLLWNDLSRNLMLIKREIYLTKSLDRDHIHHWSQIELAVDSLSELVSDVLDRYQKGDIRYLNATPGKGWIISSKYIRDDLVKIDKALSSDIILGAHPQVKVSDEELTEAMEAANKLLRDVELARRALSIPKILHIEELNFIQYR